MDAPKPKPPTQKFVTVTQLGTNKKVTVSAEEVKKTSTVISSMPEDVATAPLLPEAQETKRNEKPAEDKRPFVLKPHLTERPLKHHEGLQQLRESISPKRGRK